MPKITPISPDDVVACRQATIPDFVIEAFNTCIAAAYANGAAVVRLGDVVAAILRSMPSDDSPAMDRARIFRERWLDVEDLYRAQGWAVTLDKPGYNESYPASFTFKRRRDRDDG